MIVSSLCGVLIKSKREESMKFSDYHAVGSDEKKKSNLGSIHSTVLIKSDTKKTT